MRFGGRLAKQYAQSIEELGSPNFRTRELAHQSLREAGKVAEPYLRKALASAKDLEARIRMDQLLNGLNGKKQKNEQLRLVPPIEVLERLASGMPGFLRTKEAAASLQRLARKR